MEENSAGKSLSFFARLGLAFRVLTDGELAAKTLAATEKAEEPAPASLPPEKVHASGLMLLSALQRDGRLVDFLQQDVSAFSDEEVGAAARVVHGGCRKVLRSFFELEPACPEGEGSSVTVPAGFDAQRFRLTGNVTGSPPFRGALRHHGWFARTIRMPALSESLDARVIAPAEVELT
jgi:hypothetical protein